MKKLRRQFHQPESKVKRRKKEEDPDYEEIKSNTRGSHRNYYQDLDDDNDDLGNESENISNINNNDNEYEDENYVEDDGFVDDKDDDFHFAFVADDVKANLLNKKND